jgi:Na+(H+)/acetate symporter ActP
MGVTASLLVIQIIKGNISVVFSSFSTAIAILNPLIYFSYFWSWTFNFGLIISNLIQILFTVYFSYSIYMMMKR